MLYFSTISLKTEDIFELNIQCKHFLSLKAHGGPKNEFNRSRGALWPCSARFFNTKWELVRASSARSFCSPFAQNFFTKEVRALFICDWYDFTPRFEVKLSFVIEWKTVENQKGHNFSVSFDDSIIIKVLTYRYIVKIA